MDSELDEYIRKRAEQKAAEILRDEPENRKRRLANVGWEWEELPRPYQLRILIQATIIKSFQE